ADHRRVVLARRIDLAHHAGAVGDEDRNEPGIDLGEAVDDALPLGGHGRRIRHGQRQPPHRALVNGDVPPDVCPQRPHRPAPSPSCFAEVSWPSTAASSSTGSVATSTNAWNAYDRRRRAPRDSSCATSRCADAPVAIRSATTTATRPLSTTCIATGRMLWRR